MRVRVSECVSVCVGGFADVCIPVCVGETKLKDEEIKKRL